jgi:spermidine synthase
VRGDIRAFLRGKTGPPFYDVALLVLPDPATLLFNRFYTAEFFALVRSRLSPDGILALSLGEPANYLSRTQGAYLAAVDRALEPSFPSRVFHPLGRYLVAAGPSRLTLLDPERAGKTAGERGLELKFVRPQELSARLTPDRMRMAVRVMRASGIRANTDRRPRAVLHRLAQWGETGGQGGGGPARWVDSRQGQRAAVGAILLLAAGLGWLGFGPTPGRRAATTLLLGGAAGMAAELTILYQAQATLGTVYGMMALFFALFMAGAAYGGFLQAAPPRRVAAEWAALFTVLALLPFMTAPGLTLLLPLMAVGGYLTGRSYRSGADILAGMGSANPAAAAYALDLGGAAAGAVLAGLLLPFTLGMGGGAYLGLALAGGVLLAARG